MQQKQSVVAIRRSARKSLNPSSHALVQGSGERKDQDVLGLHRRIHLSGLHTLQHLRGTMQVIAQTLAAIQDQCKGREAPNSTFEPFPKSQLPQSLLALAGMASKPSLLSKECCNPCCKPELL